MSDTVIFIQARMGSHRLPGKVLRSCINKKSILEVIIDRLNKVKNIKQVYVLTSNKKDDLKIVDECNKLGVNVFSGDEKNVLKRFYDLAKTLKKINIIVRICADSPLHDPDIIDQGIQYFKKNKFDYVSNCFPRTFPYGTAVEVFYKSVLKTVYQNVVEDNEKEHVTPYIINNPDKFRLGNFSNDIDLSHHRWTLDYVEDYKMISAIYKELYPNNPNFGMMDVVKLLEERPDIYEITAHLPRD